MSLRGFLVGILTAEVNPKNIKSLWGFLSERLDGKPVEIEVEANGRQIKIKATSKEDLEAAMQAAKAFLEAQNDVGGIPPWED